MSSLTYWILPTVWESFKCFLSQRWINPERVVSVDRPQREAGSTDRIHCVKFTSSNQGCCLEVPTCPPPHTWTSIPLTILISLLFVCLFLTSFQQNVCWKATAELRLGTEQLDLGFDLEIKIWTSSQAFQADVGPQKPSFLLSHFFFPSPFGPQKHRLRFITVFGSWYPCITGLGIAHFGLCFVSVTNTCTPS